MAKHWIELRILGGLVTSLWIRIFMSRKGKIQIAILMGWSSQKGIIAISVTAAMSVSLDGPWAGVWACAKSGIKWTRLMSTISDVASTAINSIQLHTFMNHFEDDFFWTSFQIIKAEIGRPMGFLASSFAPFGHSGRVTHAMMWILTKKIFLDLRY